MTAVQLTSFLGRISISHQNVERDDKIKSPKHCSGHQRNNEDNALLRSRVRNPIDKADRGPHVCRWVDWGSESVDMILQSDFELPGVVWSWSRATPTLRFVNNDDFCWCCCKQRSTMKLSQSLVSASILLSTSWSFAPQPRASRFVSNSRLLVATEQEIAAEVDEDGSSKNTDIPEDQIIARIGITEEELAIGVSAADFLKYAGTYVW